MSAAEATATAEKAKKSPPTPKTPEERAVKRALRKGLKTKGRKKRLARIRTDLEFAKTYFEARSKRATQKKSDFRKKKARKK